MQQLYPLIERQSARWWLLTGGFSAIGLFAGTWVTVGLMDGVLIACGASAGLLGGVAAKIRRTIDRLPLVVAPHLAHVEGLRGSELTLRACLGRGRSYAIAQVDVWVDDQPVEVLHHSGPGVGPFQIAFPGRLDADVRVRISVEEASEKHVQTATFGASDIRAGRFVSLYDRKQTWLDAREFGRLR